MYQTRCQYFERYGDSGCPGFCAELATLALIGGEGAGYIRPPICVCEQHAQTITSRFPELGTIKDRFVSVDALDHFGRL